jgi:peptidyl-prolyl cis-trans isomerase A (cyclophilin A)
MTTRFVTVILIALLLPVSLFGQQVQVVIETKLGEIVVQLESDRAPVTVANFLRYVDEKLYDGGRFHRAVRLDNQNRSDVPIEVIQGGRAPERVKAMPGFGSVPLERTSVTGLKHLDGTISMARGAAADTAVSDFFICINDQPSLDEGGARSADKLGFGAFGRVISGMEIVRQIQSRPAPKERLEQPVLIVRIHRK